MKYNKWIGMAACILLIAVCFMPWTYHADVQKNFTGFFSQNDAYGKPGKFFVFFSIIAFGLIVLQKVWAQRIHLFFAGVMLAYAIKTYILYTSCYNAYCPDKKAGIFLMLGLTLVIFASSLFPDIKIDTDKKEK
ncbi:MAG: hypothetical protein ACOYLO_03780 [Ferruginibacter sp.]